MCGIISLYICVGTNSTTGKPMSKSAEYEKLRFLIDVDFKWTRSLELERRSSLD